MSFDRIFCILVMYFLAFESTAQSDLDTSLGMVDAADPSLERVNGLLYLGSAPFSGYVVETYENGNLKSKVGWLNGKREGLSEAWYSDGSERERREYSENRKTGSHLGWYEDGTRKFDLNLKDGVYHGRCRQWFANGQLATEFHFVEGQEVGSQRSWNYKGELQGNYVVREGHRYGLIGSKSCLTVGRAE